MSCEAAKKVCERSERIKVFERGFGGKLFTKSFLPMVVTAMPKASGRLLPLDCNAIAQIVMDIFELEERGKDF